MQTVGCSRRTGVHGCRVFPEHKEVQRGWSAVSTDRTGDDQKLMEQALQGLARGFFLLVSWEVRSLF